MTNQELIRQYVDTGVEIPEYQFNKLSNNLKKTYLRKRSIVFEEELDEPYGMVPYWWEVDLLPNAEYIKSEVRDRFYGMDESDEISDFDVQFLDKKDQIKFLESKMYVSNELYDKLSPENKRHCFPIRTLSKK